MNIENKICEAIEMIVDNSISKADFDRTIQATILSCTNALTKEYKIKYQDNILTAYANGEANYKKDTLVYVLVPNNDLSKQKTILGAVNKDQESYSTVVNQDQTYDFIGINAIKNNQLALNSHHTETKILYSYQNNIEENLISVDNFVIEEYIKQNNTIYCSANFQTSLISEQQRYGNYGIIFALDFLNNENQIVTKYYSININNMQGNPYKLLQPTKQYAFFDIDNENFLRLNSITIFVKDFPGQDEDNQINDIFITDICLQAANKMTSDELAGYSINLNTPNGSIFSENSTSDSFLPINAVVKLKGQEIEASNSIEFYWFIEDASIKTSSEYYNIYGGIGWKCLNKKQILENSISYLPGENNINIKFSDAIARNNIIKCVAVYSGNIFNKTINIKNYLAVNITIVSDSGTSFYYDQGNPILTCLVDGKEYPNYIYNWIQIDENGITEIENNKYQYQVNIGQLNSYATFKCAVTQNKIVLGTASITLTNSRESEQDYILTILNGDQVFKYDENGISPISQVNETPLQIAPLRLQLTSVDAGDISEEILKNLQIEWEIPQENTLLVVEADSPKTIELYYTIATNYSYQKTNNQIKATVVYQGQKITASTNFLFLKDGDPGTNGTNYVCKIVPNIEEGQSVPGRIIYNTYTNRLNYIPATENTQWVRAQLWESGELIFDSTSSEGDFTLTWSILQNKYDYTTKDYSNLKIDSSNGKITCDRYSEDQTAANIVKASISYNGTIYTAFLPITLVNLKNSSYNISIKEKCGFDYVTYSTDGIDPQYNKTNPFEISLYYNNTNVTENTDVAFLWEPKGVIYEDGEWKKQNLIIETSLKDETLNKNQKRFKPASSYDGQCVTIAIECIIRAKNEEVARALIPIYYGINRYGLSALNGWDGNSIQASAEGGFILSPQVGAGRKEEDNSFTGLVLGEVKEGSNSKKNVGLFGYNKGQRSIFLDAESGTAAFGVADQGQVIIDPTEGRALIRSGNYVQNKSGMAIDLTTPEIIYGNGNFSVNKDGELNAAVGTLGASDSSKIHIGGTATNSYIYSGNKDNLTANSMGFYLGTNGFSMGAASGGQSAFQIDPSGNVDAASLTIQNASTSSARIELSAGSSYSQITFYRNNSNKGYIYGGSSGIEIYGNSSLNISGSSMDISANTMDISSSTLYIRSSRLYARNSSGSVAPAVNGTYSLLTKTGCYVGGIGPVLIWYNSKVNLTFYNGILVNTSESEDGDYNDG